MRFSFEFRVSPQVPKAGLVIDAGWVGEQWVRVIANLFAECGAI